MTRFLTKMTVAMAAVALIATAATAQGWGRGRGMGMGMGMGSRLAAVSPEDQQKVTDLHQKVRTAQQELWTLKAQAADKKKIDQKTSEVLKLRGELAKVMTNLPAGPCYQLSQGGTSPQVGVAPGVGFGRGRGMCGRGMGFGRGGGWGGPGTCWRWQTPTPPATTQ